MLLVLVQHRFFLDLAALVAGLHRAQHATALGDALEFLQHRFFDQVGQFVEDERALVRVLVLCQTPFAVDDQLDCQSTTDRFIGRRGDRFVIRIGMQRVTVVIDRDQRLQRGADVIEIDFLRMQRAARGLDVVLQFLAALVRAILVAHCHGPDAARDAAQHRVLRVHAIGEEERQVGRKIIDVHAARQIGFDKGEAIRQRERQLRDRVRASFSDVITRDRYRIEVAHLVVDEVLLDVAHYLQRKLGREDASILALIFLQDVGLHRAAHVLQHPGLDLRRFLEVRLAALFVAELVELLVDRGVHEHREDGRRRAVDGHRYRGGRVAQVEAVVQHLHVFDSGDRHARVADLAVDVGTQRRVGAIQRHRVECGRQALGRHAFGHQLEATVGAECITFAGEHTGRVFVLALEREHAGRIREAAGQVFLHQPGQQVAVVAVIRQRDLAHAVAGERLVIQAGTDFLVADLHHMLVARVGGAQFRPGFEQLACIRRQRLIALRDQVVEVGMLAGRRQQTLGLGQLLALARDRRLLRNTAMVLAHRIRDLGQIAAACRWHDGITARGRAHIHRCQLACTDLQAELGQLGQQALIQRGHAIVIEARRLRAEYRHLLGRLAPGFAVALHLLGDIAQRILCALAVELVDRDEVGEVQHVDLFQLRRGAEFRRHHVQAGVHMRHDRRIALANARGLDDHQVEAGHAAGGNDIGQRLRNFGACFARRQRAHEHARLAAPRADRIHADAVAEQRAARLAARRIDRNHGDIQLVILIDTQAADQLIRQ